MADARVHPEAPAAPHVTIHRKDYRPPDWLVPSIALDFRLDPERTLVAATLSVRRNGDHDRPIRLNGDGIVPLSVRVDGRDANWRLDGDDLLIDLTGDEAEIATEVAIAPAANSQLMGLYESGGNLCTQCEAEGFRRITFFPDRPDVLSRYRVRMEADRARFPILLSNGNPAGTGSGDDGRHWAVWDDPFPKPSYLFALVAGDLHANRDRFVTRSGKPVDLAIWVREPDLPRTGHAMESLKAAMAWDERVYGREYDLAMFNIVAVSDFNMGAMENKGLNVFNTRYILADAETATDGDFDAIAAVVAHEYFHNWSGNRVTCRDWFQLSLKEGFTVFRDQQFSADMGSAAVKRIEDVRTLRLVQFPEDNGPLAHPVRPESFIEISNFYTATVYNKGAELIRMFHGLLGAKAFRAGTDLYFDRHDGEAATCDDFVKALEDASGADLSAMKVWYEQAGTPRVEAALDQGRPGDPVRLRLRQSVPATPGQPEKAVMPIPLRTAIIGRDSGRPLGEERLLLFDTPEATVEFGPFDEPAMLSINRGFSAPVNLDVERRPGELEKLARHDSDPFARYEAIQDLALGAMLDCARGGAADFAPLGEAVRATLADDALDPAFQGEALLLPSEAMIAERMVPVDPGPIHRARDAARQSVGTAAMDALLTAQARAAPGHDLSPAAKGIRRLRSVALGLIAAADPAAGAALAKAQYDGADNMTDRQGALAVLVSLHGQEREDALADFQRRFSGDALVIDKWFALQAMSQRDDAVDAVERLLGHPEFTLKNPNRLRALAGSFAMNHVAFHDPSGRGYALLARLILDADPINPQIAARLAPPFGRWRRMEPRRSCLMREVLEDMVARPGLSRDLYEQVSKSLA